MQSLMLLLSEVIVGMDEFLYIFLNQKENPPRNKNRNSALCNMKNTVNQKI